MKLKNATVGSLPAKGSDTLYADDDLPNFYLRIRAGGSRSYVVQWRQNGLQRRVTLGKVGHLTLDEARRRARKMLVNISDGYDPHVAKAKSRIDDKQIFETLAREYLEVRSRDMRARSLEQCRLHLLTYFMPLHKLPLKKLDRATVAAELRTIARDRGPVAADRGRSSLSSFLAWSIGEGILETNVVIGTNRQSKGASRERVLTDAELVAIWNVLPNSDFGRILKLLTLTGQRRSEIADLRWAEIEADAISLPAARTKNGRAHVVPLSPQARGVLDEVPQRDGRQLVFGEGNGGYSGFAVAKIKLDEGCGVTGWVVHDLRRTAATRMADLGIAPHIVESVLNHAGHRAGVSGTYNKSTYAPEKRAALDLWGTHIQMLLARAEGANVTLLRKPGQVSGG